MKKIIFLVLILFSFTSCKNKSIDLNNGSLTLRIKSKNIATREVVAEVYVPATLNKIDLKTTENEIFYDDYGFKYQNTDEYYSDNVKKVIRDYDDYPCFVSNDDKYGDFLASEYNNDIIYDLIEKDSKYKISDGCEIVLLNQIDQDSVGIVEVRPTLNEYFDDEYIKKNTQPDLFSLCNVEIKNGNIINMKYIYEP